MNKTNDKCYLCGNQSFSQRRGSVRDNTGLKILECTSCGLVFLSSFDHVRNGFYEDSGKMLLIFRHGSKKQTGMMSVVFNI